MTDDTLTLDRKHTAPLVMDYQNAIIPVVAEKYPDLLNRAAAVLAAAHAAELPIIYIIVSFREGYPEVSSRNRSFSAARGSGRMLAGTHGTEVHPQVAPRPGDVVLTKHRVGAFSTTPLETILRAQEGGYFARSVRHFYEWGRPLNRPLGRGYGL